MIAARLTRGAISLSNSSHFARHCGLAVHEPGDASTWSRQACHEYGAHRFIAALTKITSGCSSTNSLAKVRIRPTIANGPTIIDPHIAAVRPAQFLQFLCERREIGPHLRIVRSTPHQHFDSLHPLGLLPSRRGRRHSRRTAEEDDELPPFQLVQLHPSPSGCT